MNNKITKKELIFSAMAILMVFLIIVFGMEILARTVLNTGMQYDLEMWKYAKYGKRVSENPNIGHLHKKNVSFKAMGVDVDLNSYGFRDAELSETKSDDEVRIVMLGDSLTFGWGVPQNSTVSARLEEKFKKDGFNVDVINTGIGNTNTSMQVSAFLEHYNFFKPDSVILNYFINDAETTPVHKKKSGFLARYSYAYNFFTGRWDSFIRIFFGNENWEEYYNSLYDEKSKLFGWDKVESSVSKLKQFCLEKDIPLMFVNYPEIRQLRPYPFNKVNNNIEKLVQQNDIYYVDLLNALENEKPETLWVSKPDPHPNEYANGIISDYLYNVIKLQSNNYLKVAKQD